MRNEQNIVGGNKGGLKTKKFETKYDYISSYFFVCSFIFYAQTTFVALCFSLPMT
jgi:hypothetical protein